MTILLSKMRHLGSLMWCFAVLYVLLCMLLDLTSALGSSSSYPGFQRVLHRRRKLKISPQGSSNIDEDPKTSRNPRLIFSNPFGIMGHRKCATTSAGRPVTGVCYNEVECLVKGGNYANYCDLMGLSGVCCAFVHKNCERKVTQSVAYFTNPSYPKKDSEPVACQLKIAIKKDTCWVCGLFTRLFLTCSYS